MFAARLSTACRAAACAALAVGLAGSAHAQTLWAIDNAAPACVEFNTPPACPLTPPPYSVLPSPTLGGFPSNQCLGGTAVDNDGPAWLPGVAVVINSDLGDADTVTEALIADL